MDTRLSVKPFGKQLNFKTFLNYFLFLKNFICYILIIFTLYFPPSLAPPRSPRHTHTLFCPFLKGTKILLYAWIERH